MSPSRHAATASAVRTIRFAWPSPATAPAASNTGIAGMGRPACSARTVRNTTSSMWRRRNSNTLCTQHLADGHGQCSRVIRAVLLLAVDEKCGRACHAMRPARAHIGSDTLEIVMRLERLTEGRLVEPELSRVVHQIAVFKLPLMRKQQGMHLPECSLCGGRLGGLRRLDGMGMLLGEGEMPKHEAKIAAEFTL